MKHGLCGYAFDCAFLNQNHIKHCYSFVKIFFRLFCPLGASGEQEHNEIGVIGRTHTAGGAVSGTPAHVVNQDQACTLVGDLHNVLFDCHKQMNGPFNFAFLCICWYWKSICCLQEPHYQQIQG